MKRDALPGTFNILLVDDDPIVIAAMGSLLQEFGPVRFATSGADALRLARQTLPDLVLLDIEMPGMSGFEVCAAMKESTRLADVPVIFITSHDSIEQEVMGLSLGAADFISKPPRPPLVVARVRMHLRMKKMADALRRAADTDALTGVANRRQFDETLQREWLRAQRTGTFLSLVMVDIDAFKKYNDQYGHQAGDACLRTVAQAMQAALHRPADLLARVGGEEFALLLPDTDTAGACNLATKVVQAVDCLRLVHAASPVGKTVSISAGVSSYDKSCESWVGAATASRFGMHGPRPTMTDLIAAADQALYAAKEGGRRHARLLRLDDLGMPGAAVDLRTCRPDVAQDELPQGLTRA